MPGEWGLSVEQRKRLTIAVELVANPSVVFMDEPTSGLDARAAAIVMRAVRNTVDTGRTVVCTIHQPSIHIFDVSSAWQVYACVQRRTRALITVQRHSCAQYFPVHVCLHPGLLLSTEQALTTCSYVARVVQAFDELLLLKRGGRTIFHGALGADSVKLIDYFTSAVPAVEPPQNDLNPATWMLDISAVGAEAQYQVDWADIYADSELRR